MMSAQAKRARESSPRGYDKILDLTRGRDATPFDRSVDMQVSRLRRRLGVDAAVPEYIRTVRSQGYLFVPPVRRS